MRAVARVLRKVVICLSLSLSNMGTKHVYDKMAN